VSSVHPPALVDITIATRKSARAIRSGTLDCIPAITRKPGNGSRRFMAGIGSGSREWCCALPPVV